MVSKVTSPLLCSVPNCIPPCKLAPCNTVTSPLKPGYIEFGVVCSDRHSAIVNVAGQLLLTRRVNAEWMASAQYSNRANSI